ncbi:MAG TPA: hypothetical protein H9694_06760 [Firmicutes bacterium]|nr:hypothetical protein [Bacillota bacterium]
MKRGRCCRVYRVKSQPAEIDYEKLADAIVAAHERIEKDAEHKAERETKHWKELIGRKEYSHEKNRVKRACLNGANSIRCTLKILFIKKKDAKTDRGTFVLLKTLLVDIFWLAKWFLYLLSLGLIFSSFYDLAQKSFAFNGLYILYALFAWIVARLFRLVALEVDNMEDRNYLFAVFSSVTSFVAMILALVALFLEGCTCGK